LTLSGNTGLQPARDGIRHHGSGAMTWRRARSVAATGAEPLGVERVAVADAVGRVLAAQVCSPVRLPGGDCAAMDGYAVSGPGPWLITGPSLAGHTGPDEIRPGTAVEIATGALIPKGTQLVLPYENCRLDGAMVTGQPHGRNHIRQAGDDLRVGEVLAQSGTVVRAVLAGLISHAGLDEVVVRQRPRVRVLVTGDEIVHHGLPPVGHIRDALGPLVTAFVQWSGAAVTQTRHLGDDVQALVDGLHDGDWDVAVVTGSSSVGPADHLHEVLDSMEAALLVDVSRAGPGTRSRWPNCRTADGWSGCPGTRTPAWPAA
jgi:molybdopterin molybdotransferase